MHSSRKGGFSEGVREKCTVVGYTRGTEGLVLPCSDTCPLVEIFLSPFGLRLRSEKISVFCLSPFGLRKIFGFLLEAARGKQRECTIHRRALELYAKVDETFSFIYLFFTSFSTLLMHERYSALSPMPPSPLLSSPLLSSLLCSIKHHFLFTC